MLDRISYQLHGLASSKGGAVAREWPIPGTSPTARADVAVVSGEDPVVLVEGKAMYTFASLRNNAQNEKYVDRMQSDLDRLASAELGRAEVFTLMFAANPREPIPDDLWTVVKKPREINSALKKLGGHQAVADFTLSRMSELTVPRALAGAGVLDAGEAYGIGVDILWWIFGPFSSLGGLQLCAKG